jgi:hypothetical protein
MRARAGNAGSFGISVPITFTQRVMLSTVMVLGGTEGRGRGVLSKPREPAIPAKAAARA